MTNQPHDALFRMTFSRKEHAIGELKAVLPPALVEQLDWESLRIEDGHYVDEDLTKGVPIK
jgi:predicted transposase YdaD